MVFKPDLSGYADVMQGAGVCAAVDALAEQIAENVRANLGSVTEAVVETHSGTTSSMKVNRARASATIAHPAGLAMQAKHGTLTKAAAAVGLKVTSK